MTGRTALLVVAIAVAVGGCGRFGFASSAPGDGDQTPFDGPVVDTTTDDAIEVLDDALVDAAPCIPPALVCENASLDQMLGVSITTGTTSGQGDEFTTACGGGGAADVAFRWTAPTAGRYVLDTRGSQFDTVLSVRDTCGAATTACNNDDPVGATGTSMLSLDFAACQSTVVVVDGLFTAGSYDLSIRRKCPGTDLGTLVPATAMGTTADQGDSYSSTCGGNAAPDVVYQWTAPAAARYMFDTRGSSLDTVLSLRDSCTASALQCNNDDPVGSTGTSAFYRDMIAGEQVYLVVDSAFTGGAYTLRINRKCPGTELGMTLGLVASGTTSGAGDAYTSSCGGNGNPDVVYQWVAPAEGRYVIDTRGSSLDTTLSLRDSCTANLTACNDDDPVGGTGTSAISYDFTAGQAVTIVVDGSFTSGTYVLNANKKCPGTNLGSGVGANVASGTTTGKGDSYACGSGGMGGPDVTYTWRAPATGNFKFDTQGSAIDTLLAVRPTCTGPIITCNDDNPTAGSWSEVTVALTANQEVVLVIDTAFGSGSYQLNITQL